MLVARGSGSWQGGAWGDPAMPQIQLPMFPAGVTHITAELAFECRDGTVTYFNADLAREVSAGHGDMRC